MREVSTKDLMGSGSSHKLQGGACGPIPNANVQWASTPYVASGPKSKPKPKPKPIKATSSSKAVGGARKKSTKKKVTKKKTTKKRGGAMANELEGGKKRKVTKKKSTKKKSTKKRGGAMANELEGGKKRKKVTKKKSTKKKSIKKRGGCACTPNELEGGARKKRKVTKKKSTKKKTMKKRGGSWWGDVWDTVKSVAPIALTLAAGKQKNNDAELERVKEDQMEAVKRAKKLESQYNRLFRDYMDNYKESALRSRGTTLKKLTNEEKKSLGEYVAREKAIRTALLKTDEANARARILGDWVEGIRKV